MSGRRLSAVLGLLLVFALAAGSVFIVHDGERPVLVRLGSVIATDIQPGMRFKLPVVDMLHRLDGRVQTLNGRVEGLRSKDEGSLGAEFFVKWQILDAGKYYRESGGDTAKIPAQISQLVQDALAEEFAAYTTEETIVGVSRERMKSLVSVTARQAQDSGVAILDLRLKSVDLQGEAAQTIYSRMQTERSNAVGEMRARGDAEAVQARAEADRQRETILAEGFRQSEEIRADGDAQAGDIYSNAYSRNPEFYSFYRSLDVYQNTLRNKGDILILEPDGELFRYFNPPAASH